MNELLLFLLLLFLLMLLLLLLTSSSQGHEQWNEGAQIADAAAHFRQCEL